MIFPGKYSVWFKTPVGEGAGVVELSRDGNLSGGDTTFAYKGEWTQDGERFKATLSARRVVPGPPGVFGMDEIDIVVSGHSQDAGPEAGSRAHPHARKLAAHRIRMRDGAGAAGGFTFRGPPQADFQLRQYLRSVESSAG
jgi:hypothetical protein